MENNIVDLYLNHNYSLKKICEEFKIGKIKVKNILIKNGIQLNKKGGQKKHTIIDVDHTKYNNKSLECKKTGKIINDILNRSGFITVHLKKEYNLKIPSLYKRNMVHKTTGELWYGEYFNIVDTEIKEQWSCPVCDYTTNDVDNLGGFITRHVREHDFYDLATFNDKYPNSGVPMKGVRIDFGDSNTYINCGICNEPFRSITNTHLNNHNITMDEYRDRYGETMSKCFMDDCKGYLDCGRENITQNFTSKSQNEINEFIVSLGFETSVNNKKTLNGTEIDIFIPSHNIGFEYNGLFWHSEKMGKTKNYHIGKQMLARKMGVRLFHIFSDEWLNKKDIVKNKIKHILNVSTDKLYARKCVIKEITTEEKGIFLDNNHIQGNDKSKIKLGAYHDGELVSVMTFSKERIVLGSKGVDDCYELVRFSSKNVVGVGSKLLKYFIKNYNPKKIVSYADRRWTLNEDNVYQKMGFTLSNQGKPNYWYVLGDTKRLHRFNFRKDILIKKGYDKNKTEKQIMDGLGYLRVWDCGNYKYELNLT